MGVSFLTIFPQMAEAATDAVIAIVMLGFPIALAISFGYVIGGVVN